MRRNEVIDYLKLILKNTPDYSVDVSSEGIISIWETEED